MSYEGGTCLFDVVLAIIQIQYSFIIIAVLDSPFLCSLVTKLTWKSNNKPIEFNSIQRRRADISLNCVTATFNAIKLCFTNFGLFLPF